MNQVIENNYLKIKCSDGQELDALVLVPEQRLTKAVVQFHSGTVVKKEYYLKYGQYLCDLGFVVVLFDYRGVGGSRPKSLRGFSASISDWGCKDAPAILNWIKDTYKDLPTYLFAHSMGGQILGLMPNWNLFDKIIFLASSSGNWNNFEKTYQNKIKRSSNLFFPFVLPLFGYAPGRFGLGEDWPKGVTQDWWYNSRNNGLMAEYMQSKYSNTYYKNINSSIRAIFLADDHMATARTVPNIRKSYPSAEVIVDVIRPEQFDLDKIGHFGLFKDWTRGELWDYVVREFDQN